MATVNFCCNAGNGPQYPNGRVEQIAKTSGGDIVIVGQFDHLAPVSGAPSIHRPSIARLDTNFNLLPQAWKPLPANSVANPIIACMALDGSDNIYIVGRYLTRMEVLPYGQFAQLGSDGGVVGGYNAPTFAPATVPGNYPAVFAPISTAALECCLWYPNKSLLWVGGNYNQVGSATGLATLNPFDTTGNTPPPGYTWTYSGSGDVAGVQYDTIDTSGDQFFVWASTITNDACFSRMYNSGSAYSTFKPYSAGLTSGGPAKFGVACTGSSLICVGPSLDFENGDGNICHGIVKLDGTTAAIDTTFRAWHSYGFADASGNTDDPACVIVQSSGKMVIGYDATSHSLYDNATAPANLLRLNADGTLDTSWTTSADGKVFHILQESGGTMLVGGTFTHIGPNPGALVARNYLARLDVNGNVL
jgi:hypothetical protein